MMPFTPARAHVSPNRRAAIALLAVAPFAGGCANILPAKPERPLVFDFGPMLVPAGGATALGLPLALGEIEVTQALDSSAMLYRLRPEAQRLRPFASARWSAPPAELVRQRLRVWLAQGRPVVNIGDTLVVHLLRIELEEFSQMFETERVSTGQLVLGVSLTRRTPSGEVPVAQRQFAVSRSAPTADPTGGAIALAQAVDAVAAELAGWLDAVMVR